MNLLIFMTCLPAQVIRNQAVRTRTRTLPGTESSADPGTNDHATTNYSLLTALNRPLIGGVCSERARGGPTRARRVVNESIAAHGAFVTL